MEQLKLAPNYQREIGSGQLFGCCQFLKITENGQLPEKLILWKVEETLDTQKKLVVVLKLLGQPYIGDHTFLLIDMNKLTHLTPYQAELLLMISTLSDSIGMRNNFILMLILQITKFYKSIIKINHSGNKVNSQMVLSTHGNILTINLLHLTLNFI